MNQEDDDIPESIAKHIKKYQELIDEENMMFRYGLTKKKPAEPKGHHWNYVKTF